MSLLFRCLFFLLTGLFVVSPFLKQEFDGASLLSSVWLLFSLVFNTLHSNY